MDWSSGKASLMMSCSCVSHSGKSCRSLNDMLRQQTSQFFCMISLVFLSSVSPSAFDAGVTASVISSISVASPKT
eukprot:4072304-Prymnesium_polylepis.2